MSSENSMDPDFWISQLGRLYIEADDHVGEGGHGGNSLANQFNELLENLQEAFLDNEFVQNMETVSGGSPMSPAGMAARQDAPSEVRMKCGQLADALGYDLPDIDSSDSPVNVVQVETHQSAEQTVEQTVTMESTVELVNHLSRDQETADELHHILEEFQAELESDEPDESRLRQFVESAAVKSPEVAANLGMLALQKGIISVLGL